MARRHVSRRERDGENTGRTKAPIGASADSRAARRLGAAAQDAQRPRWSNPYMGETARQWTQGWNVRHLASVGGTCEGCALCGVGTRSVHAREEL